MSLGYCVWLTNMHIYTDVCNLGSHPMFLGSKEIRLSYRRCSTLKALNTSERSKWLTSKHHGTIFCDLGLSLADARQPKGCELGRCSALGGLQHLGPRPHVLSPLPYSLHLCTTVGVLLVPLIRLLLS